jgi:hypothetical protein
MMCDWDDPADTVQGLRRRGKRWYRCLEDGGEYSLQGMRGTKIYRGACESNWLKITILLSYAKAAHISI